jgi:hypothetical protein
MSLNTPGLGSKAPSKVADMGISGHLDAVGDLDIDIHTNPGKIIQGQVDSATISGKGLVRKEDLRMETLEVHIDQTAVNPMKDMLAHIELTHATDTEVEIVLTEDDVNRAFSSKYIQDKLYDVKMDMEGLPVTVDIQHAAVSMPGDNKVVITAEFLFIEQGELKRLSAMAIPHIQDDRNCISLNVISAEGQGLTKETVVSIFRQFTSLLDTGKFNTPGMSLQLKQLKAQKGKLVIKAQTQVEQLPSLATEIYHD